MTGDSASELVGGTDVTPKSTTDQNTTAKADSENNCTSSATPVANSHLVDDKLPDLALNRQTEENTDSAVNDPPIKI